MSAKYSRKILIVASGAIILFASLAFIFQRPLCAQYHRSFVADSRTWYERPTTLRGYFSSPYIRWMLDGRPEATRQIEIGKKHEDVLVRMKYFDRGPYHFSIANREEFVSKVSAASLHDRLFYFRFGSDGAMEVLAHRDDFPKIEQIIHSFGGQKWGANEAPPILP